MAEDVTYIYDVFISYSSKDSEFAKSLQKALEGYSAPKSLALTNRKLKAFRYESDMTGTDYHEAITKHLANARNLLVICSPNARRSIHVNGEIQIFRANAPAGKIISLLLHGKPNNDTNEENDKAFPEALMKYAVMPLAIDFRHVYGKRKSIRKSGSSWFALIAEIINKPREEVEERERIRRRNTNIIRYSTLLFILAIVSVFAYLAWVQRNIAIAERKEAEINLGKNFVAQGNYLFQANDYEHANKLFLQGQALFEKNNFTALPATYALWRAAFLAPFPVFNKTIYKNDWIRTVDAMGQSVIVSTNSGEVRFFSTNGEPGKQILKGDGHPVKALEVIKGENAFIAGKSNGYILKIDLENSDTLFAVRAGSPVNDIAINYSLQYVLSAHQDNNIRVWSLKNGDLVKTLEGHVASVTSIVTSDEGAFAISSSFDKRVMLWDLKSFKKNVVGPIQYFPVTAISLDASGMYIATGNQKGEIKVFNVTGGNAEVGSYNFQNRAIREIKFLDETIFSSSDDGSIIQADFIDNPQILKTFKAPHAVFDFDFTAGEMLLASTNKGELVKWDVTDKSIITKQKLPYSVSYPVLSEEGHLLVYHADGRIYLEDVKSGANRMVDSIKSHLRSSYLREKDSLLILTDTIGTVICMNISDFSIIKKYSVKENITGIRSYQNNILMGLAKKSTRVVKIDMHTDKISAYDLSYKANRIIPDDNNTQLTVLDVSGNLHAYDLTMKELRNKEIEPFSTGKVLMSRQFGRGNLYFIATDDHTLRLYDLQNGNPLWSFNGYEFPGFNDRIDHALISENGAICITIKDRLVTKYYFNRLKMSAK